VATSTRTLAALPAKETVISTTPSSASSATVTIPPGDTVTRAPAVATAQFALGGTAQPLASNACVRNVNLSPGRSSLRTGVTSRRAGSPGSAHLPAVLGRENGVGAGAPGAVSGGAGVVAAAVAVASGVTAGGAVDGGTSPCRSTRR